MTAEQSPRRQHDWRFSVGEERVMDALGRVPRAAFLPPHLRSQAGDNRALPIAHGQTISQPYIVALMTDLLQLEPDSKVLEVGTGCGYQTAILRELSTNVYTIEIIEPLQGAARRTLEHLGYTDIQYRVGDGSLGWPEEAPFDAIIVTCAAAELPQTIWQQLHPEHGRLVIPIGESIGDQQLMLYERTIDVTSPLPQRKCPVRFVPLTHKHKT